MATGIAPVSFSGGNHLMASKRISAKSSPLVEIPSLRLQRNSKHQGTNRNLSVRADYNDRRGGSTGDFVAGFLLGGAIFGTLAYVYAPQIRRSLLNEDEHGFRRARRPIYYDEGLEQNRLNLHEKISQLNSAIDNVYSRLRGGKKMPPVPIETDAEEATM